MKSGRINTIKFQLATPRRTNEVRTVNA